MRRLLPALVFLALAAPASAATRNFGVSGFDRVRIDGPFKVELRTGVAPYARATGSQAGIDAVVVEVQGRTLVVRHNRSAWGGYPGAMTGPVTIAVGTHEITGAWLNGAGSLAIDRIKGLSFDLSVQGAGSADVASAAVDQLRVTLFGAASASIAGTAPQLNAVVRGAGSLEASRLAVKDATIGAEGSVTVAAAVTGTAKVQAQGTAAVTLTGRPACTVRALGSASVSGCR
jgi:hypothetical protein